MPSGKAPGARSWPTPRPVDSVYAPMWRYLEQAGYDPALRVDGSVQCPQFGMRLHLQAGRRIAVKKLRRADTVALTIPYRIFVLGNRADHHEVIPHRPKRVDKPRCAELDPG